MSRENDELVGARRERLFAVAWLQWEADRRRRTAQLTGLDGLPFSLRRQAELNEEADLLSWIARTLAAGKHTYWPSYPPEGCALEERRGFFLGRRSQPSTYVTGSREHVLRELWRAEGAEWLSAQVLP